MTHPPGFRRYVFICGLHRTGTSLLARMLAAHPEIDAISDAPVPENEGAYLQGAIPHTARHGIAGHYATDPAQHYVEGDRLDTLATRERMERDWDPWFTGVGSWRVEKSPVNLTRMRLCQQLFPLSQFVVILRHPEAMAAALAKWTDQTPGELIDYALDAYELALEDAAYLHAVTILRYEDLVAGPQRHLDALTTFCGLEGITCADEVHDGNARYEGASVMNEGQAERVSALGYGPRLAVSAPFYRVSHPLRAVREAARARFDKS
ncbi:sulfotransferase family protein [Aurantiacibacter poecillastricola]|uniref:sulfotransferase family protein n=1 Tax=Aurantiacibacter poecillastricola TaxID=3064385 RepID=UPI00273E52D4|nr:sulfotransferase [Aurantiacibacter sp. 219JJ12-13]MDP5261142.1 sulfotransferase [Aurantiacibacter sp. 219JJ12-13]